MIRFRDRREAGRLLGEHLRGAAPADPVVVALPRGGVPVAFEVARELGAQLDIGLVRKLGAPGQPELGIGAIGENSVVVLDRDTIADIGVSRRELQAVITRELAELARRRELYRGDRPPLEVMGRDVIVVDDGLATGVTAVAAARAVRAQGARRVIVAVPVCPIGTEERLSGELDEIVCLASPPEFGGVGAWYEDFSQVRDTEVIELLERGADPRSNS